MGVHLQGIQDMDTLREHLTRIGKITSERKAIASRKNGKLGGRPRKPTPKPNMQGFAAIGRTIVQESATS